MFTQGGFTHTHLYVRSYVMHEGNFRMCWVTARIFLRIFLLIILRKIRETHEEKCGRKGVAVFL